MNVSQAARPDEEPTAADAGTWQDVYERLAAAKPTTLTAEQLESLAEAAFWTGRPRECIAARQQVYRRHRDANDVRRAVMAAWRLFYCHFDLDETAAASGWLQRAHRYALEIPDQIESQYVVLADADWALHNGKTDAALTFAQQAGDAGRQFQDDDLEALGLATQGRVLVAQVSAVDGLDRLDEAMVIALSGALTPFATGWIYCLVLTTCQGLGDVRRAAEWTDLAVRWSEEQGQDSWYPGLCRLHRCEVRSLRGEWSAAEQEALQVAEELAPFGNYLIGEGQYMAGEIRRRKGDYDGANDAFRRAHELGRDPQPGLALLRLAQGQPDEAAATLRLALAGGSGGLLRRARLLAARVDAELSLDNVAVASSAAAELDELADASRVPFIQAIAGIARGAVLLATGEADTALPVLRAAHDMCRELSCPYEDAQARVFLGEAAQQAGDTQTARLEFEAARTGFEQLGAAPDMARVIELLAGDAPSPRGLTAREIEVLRLVARGRSNRAIAAELFISEHTVARHLSNIFRKLDVSSRSAATSFAYTHRLA